MYKANHETSRKQERKEGGESGGERERRKELYWKKEGKRFKYLSLIIRNNIDCLTSRKYNQNY